MAKPPAASLAPAAPMPDDTAPADGADAAAPADAEDAGGEDGDDDILLTVCKEPDGGYRLIKGPKDEAAAPEDDGMGDVVTEDETGTVYDSPGALLKGILDLLNEDKSAEGGEGTADEQFQSGFGAPAAAPPAPAGIVPQKY